MNLLCVLFEITKMSNALLINVYVELNVSHNKYICTCKIQYKIN